MLEFCPHVTYVGAERTQGCLRVYVKGPEHLPANHLKAGSPRLPLYKAQCKIALQEIAFD